MGVKMMICGLGEDPKTTKKGIELTDFTVISCKGVTENILGRNEYLSKNIDAIHLEGRYNIRDGSQETKNVNELFEWYKLPAHEEKSFRTTSVSLLDVNDKLYDAIDFQKAFLVDYTETRSNKKGVMEYKARIRKFDDTKESIQK